MILDFSLIKSLKIIWKKIKSTIASKSKLNLSLDIVSIVFLCVTFFTIPSFSFISGLNRVTWFCLGAFFVVSIFNLILFYGFKIDVVFFSFVAFAISALISSAINHFKFYNFTPVFLALVCAYLYLYSKSNHKSIPYLFFGIFLATVFFLILYIVKYWNDLTSFNFERLGETFGDENDISLFMGLGFSFSFFCFIYLKTIVIKAISFVLICLFVVCGFSSGSKIFLLVCLAFCISIICLFFGKKKWYLSLIAVAIMILLFIIIINLPVFSTLKKRFLDFFSTISGDYVEDGRSNDFSTIERVNMFLDGIDLFLRKPFFGFGISGFAHYGGINNGWSHNHISETLCNFGIIGTMFYHLPFFFSFKNSSHKKDSVSRYCLAYFFFFFVSMLSVALSVEKIFSFSSGIVFAYMTNEKPIFYIAAVRKNFIHDNL